MDASAVLMVIPVIFVLVLAVVGGTFLAAARRKPTHQPGPFQGGRWNAQLGGRGPYGVLEIADGHLAFVPDGSPAPQWRVPCSHLVVRKRGLVDLEGADVEIQGPMGMVRCDVSREHINRFMTNDFKMFRERGYADEFLAVAAAHGARVAR